MNYFLTLAGIAGECCIRLDGDCLFPKQYGFVRRPRAGLRIYFEQCNYVAHVPATMNGWTRVELLLWRSTIATNGSEEVPSGGVVPSAFARFPNLIFRTRVKIKQC